MRQGELLYEGKAKQIYATENSEKVLMSFKDDATAFDGAKYGTIKNKGVVNNQISCSLLNLLEGRGIETHLVKMVSERNALVKRLKMLPIEVVVRNRVAGSLTKRIGKEEGFVLPGPILELYYKNDCLHDPMINEYHALIMDWANQDQLEQIKNKALKINQVLQEFFDKIGIILVDFKLEFGLFQNRVVLGDEISPDTCRFWDKQSLEKLDKDRFRKDLGGEEEAYLKIAQRVKKALE